MLNEDSLETARNTMILERWDTVRINGEDTQARVIIYNQTIYERVKDGN